jgi:hypothetical protein
MREKTVNLSRAEQNAKMKRNKIKYKKLRDVWYQRFKVVLIYFLFFSRLVLKKKSDFLSKNNNNNNKSALDYFRKWPESSFNGGLFLFEKKKEKKKRIFVRCILFLQLYSPINFSIHLGRWMQRFSSSLKYLFESKYLLLLLTINLYFFFLFLFCLDVFSSSSKFKCKKWKSFLFFVLHGFNKYFY